MEDALALFLPAALAVAVAYVLFRYFNRKAGDPRPDPAILTLRVDERAFVVTDSRKIKSLDVRWQDIRQVSVIRTDTGPFSDNLLYHVAYAGGDITLPAGANNMQAFTDHLSGLAGYDRVAHDAAVASAGNNTFSRIFTA